MTSPLPPGAFQPKYNGGPGEPNAFVTKLNAAGSALVYSTYFGAAGAVAHAIAVDHAGNAYFTGQTLDGLPVLHAVQTSFYGGTCYLFTPSGTSPTGGGTCTDAFVAALDPSGEGEIVIVYATGLGAVTPPVRQTVSRRPILPCRSRKSFQLSPLAVSRPMSSSSVSRLEPWVCIS